MHTFLRATTAVVVGGLVMAGSVATAGADPHGQVIQLHCGSQNFTVATAGNGEFTPAHDIASTTVFVPVAFGDFTGTLTDLTAGGVETFTETGTSSKGNSQARGRTPVECTYSFVEQFTAGPDDEGLIAGHLYRFDGSGEVTGFASGRP